MTKRLQPSPQHGVLWVALGASLWGTDTVLRRPLTASLSSIQIVFIEHLILTVILLPLWFRTFRTLTRVQWAAVLGIAWGGSAFGTLLFTEAIRRQPYDRRSPAKPADLSAAGANQVRERLSARSWTCLVVALIAAYLVSFGGTPPTELIHHVPAATLLALGAAALCGCSTILGRFALQDISFQALTSLRIVGAMPLLALLVWLQPHPWPALL
jgi:drug/metabolite transporter (DMT)-like permease